MRASRLESGQNLAPKPEFLPRGIYCVTWSISSSSSIPDASCHASQVLVPFEMAAGPCRSLGYNPKMVDVEPDWDETNFIGTAQSPGPGFGQVKEGLGTLGGSRPPDLPGFGGCWHP